MTLQLFGHPFSSYTMKALIALYDNRTPFEFRMLDPDHPENGAELARRWPVAKFPLLVDGDTTVFEATAIIEHLAAFHAGPVPLLPADIKAAVPVRMLDRVFDNYVMAPMQSIVFDALRPGPERDSGVAVQAPPSRPNPQPAPPTPAPTAPEGPARSRTAAPVSAAGSPAR